MISTNLPARQDVACIMSSEGLEGPTTILAQLPSWLGGASAEASLSDIDPLQAILPLYFCPWYETLLVPLMTRPA